MEKIKTKLNGVFLIQPQVFKDTRGFFMETYRENWFDQQFVQDNHSKSSQGVLRGLHFQTKNPQGKFVRVLQGSIFDVVVDINKTSPTYKQWFGVELSCENKKQLYVPQGYAHGFLVLSTTTEVAYKCTEYYNPASEKCLLWNDPEINIQWPLKNLKPILSSKDSQGLSFNQL